MYECVSYFEWTESLCPSKFKRLNLFSFLCPNFQLERLRNWGRSLESCAARSQSICLPSAVCQKCKFMRAAIRQCARESVILNLANPHHHQQPTERDESASKIDARARVKKCARTCVLRRRPIKAAPENAAASQPLNHPTKNKTSLVRPQRTRRVINYLLLSIIGLAAPGSALITHQYIIYEKSLYECGVDQRCASGCKRRKICFWNSNGA